MRTLVFSQEYVVDLFSNAFQPGIFSLSEENATVRASIEQLEAESDKIKDKINWIKTDKDKNERIAKQVREKCAERIRGSVAEIRTTELWDLMAGAKQGDRLYHAIIGHPDVLTTTTTNLISELQALKLSQGNHLAVIPTLSIPSINSQEIELLNQMLIPSENSTLSAAIARLGNIDWVASGQVWLIKDECPFCQSKIDADHLRREISALFERSWKDSIMQLENLAQRISKWLDVAKKWSSEAMLCPLVTPECPLICALNDLMKGWNNNLKLILKKISTPSQPIYLEDLSNHINSFNSAYEILSLNITEHNQRADNYQAEYEKLKQRLRSHIRFLSMDEISKHDEKLSKIKLNIDELEEQERQIKEALLSLHNEIRELQSQIVNCSDTVKKINDGLEALGISGFRIKLHDLEQDSYYLERTNGENQERVFHCLSEGEKTLIAFLYFIETCQGRRSREEYDAREKLIVIDDPISSLSQN
ncbi:hypothetical protein BBB56_14305, partial [Candidatus Pantoea deserta]